MTLKVSGTIKEGNKFEFHMVLGAMNPDKDKIKQLAENCKNIVVHQDVENMVELMTSCDIAVSAAGSALYELCACGTPTITYILADNQILGAEAFQKLDLMVNMGDVREKIQMSELVYKKCELNIDKRKEMASRMQNMVDGFGAERIVNEICI